MKSIRYVPHATKRIVEYNLDTNKIEQIIRNTEPYDDLSQIDSNRVIYVGRIDNYYWTIPCKLTIDTILVITVREPYQDEIRISKKKEKIK